MEATSLRLAATIDALESASRGTDKLPDYLALASQLFPVARMFESLGFMSVSREVAYVERALADLASTAGVQKSGPAAPTPAVIATEREPDRSPGDAILDRAPGTAEDGQAAARSDRFTIPRPVGLMLIVLLLAILGSILIVRWNDARQRRSVPETTVAAVQPTATAPAPTPSPTARTVASPTPTRAEELADLVGQARLALQQADLDRATSLVSSAALIDAGNSSVIDTAHGIVNALIARSDAVAAEGDWEREQLLLDRARELSIRFGFPIAPIDNAALRHADIIRFETIRPDDISSILAAKGRRVRVYLEGGSVEEGRIRGVNGPSLELDQSRKVGGGLRGGEVRYVEPIHLDLITEIRVYQD